MVVFVVKRYAVREAIKWRYATSYFRKAKISRYAARKSSSYLLCLLSLDDILTRFSTKILVIRWVNGGRAGGFRADGRILNGVKLRFPLNNFSLLWPIDTKLAVWVAYIKRKLGIATQVSKIKVKVTVTKIEIQFPLNNFSLLWPIDTKLLYGKLISKGSLGLLPRCLWSRSMSLLLKIEIQFPLNNFHLLWPFDTKLGLWVAYIKALLWIATQVYVIKVKVTVTKNRNSVSAQ